MIKDSCKCGATFRVDQKWERSEIKAHANWLKNHAVCIGTGDSPDSPHRTIPNYPNNTNWYYEQKPNVYCDSSEYMPDVNNTAHEPDAEF